MINTLYVFNVEVSSEHRCNECKEWDEVKITEYLKHRKSLESKSKKKPDVSVSSSPSTASVSLNETDVDKKFKEFGRQVSSDISIMFEHIMSKLNKLEEDRTNPSISAPPTVPESASSMSGGSLGDGTTYTLKTYGIRTSGRGAVGYWYPPQPHLC